jgi:hypothetical protein
MDSVENDPLQTPMDTFMASRLAPVQRDFAVNIA